MRSSASRSRCSFQVFPDSQPSSDLLDSYYTCNALISRNSAPTWKSESSMDWCRCYTSIHYCFSRSYLPLRTHGNGWRMPYTITRESAMVRVILHGAITPQDLQTLAHDLAAIEASIGVAPHRLTDLSAASAPHPTFMDVQALA